MSEHRNLEIYDRISLLKEQKDVLILAHLYQPLEIQKVADFCGDSFELAKRAKESDKQNIVFCGVKFMAESAKILNPEKHVFLPCEDAGCAMADMVTAEDVISLKEKFPDAIAVCYINSSAATKAQCDVCVTSSNALKIINNISQKEIIFVPDKNLGSYIANMAPDKKFYLHSGYCPVHKNIPLSSALSMKQKHPDALFLVHPECEGDVVNIADFIGSTSGIIDYAKKSDAREFIIGTERAVYEKLSQECPDKKFFLLDESLVCPDMKLITLDSLLDILENLDNEIVLSEEVIKNARTCLDNMLKLATR